MVTFKGPSYNHTYEYAFKLPFEAAFDVDRSVQRMIDLWPIGCWLCVIYLCSIVIGRWLMKDREAFVLRTPLILWNAGLAVFSAAGMFRFFPDFVHVLYNFGFGESVCATSFAYNVPGVWTELFALSKVLEFGDTVFIVLRKRPLLFLHWYHHITVLLYTWHSYMLQTAAGRWFVMMNYSVHAIMYTYYAARAYGMRFPRWMPMTITTLQLSQMFVGVYVVVYVYLAMNNGVECEADYKNVYFAFVMYFTYALLFAHFFYKTYFGSGKAAAAPKKLEKKMEEQNGVAKNGAVANGYSKSEAKKQQRSKSKSATHDDLSEEMVLRSRMVVDGSPTLRL